MCFNLLDAPWIPVIRRNGKPDKVGIREALTKAGEIREICAASPLDTIALYRFLLAVLQWCRPDPCPEDIARVRAESGFEGLLRELDENVDRFELLGEKYGFYQEESAWREVKRKLREAAAKKSKGKPPEEEEGKVGGLRPPTDLLQELPSGTNVAHFRHTRDFRDGICPACCAVGIIRLSAFAVSRKHGKEHQMPAGINGPTPLYAVPLGATLLESFLLNWPLHSKHNGRAGWMLDRKPKKDEIGPLTALTWRPRGLWLERAKADATKKRCTYCGECHHPLVYRIAYVPGWPKESRSDDPHVLAYIEQPSADRKKKVDPKPVAISLAHPSARLDWQALQWRRIYRAVLQGFTDKEPLKQAMHLRAAVAKAKAGSGVLLTCGGPAIDTGRAALYKDGAAIGWRLPSSPLSGEIAGRAISELDWLDGINLWSVLKKAIPRKAAKRRPEITSAVANAVVRAEPRIRQLFEELVNGLVKIEPKCVSNWRKVAADQLGQELADGLLAILSGSPLRQGEKETAAREALRRATVEVSALKEAMDESH